MTSRAVSLTRATQQPQTQMAMLTPVQPAAGGGRGGGGGGGNAGTPSGSPAPAVPRFLDPSLVGVGVGASGQHDDAAGALDSATLSKRRKAQRYRDLTCPRTRTSTLADGTRIVTVGSHVLVYPAGAAAAQSARSHPSDQAAASGAVTSFKEHPILSFSDDSFKHYSLGVGLYFKAARLLALVFALCSVIQLPAMVLSILANPGGGGTFESDTVKTTVGNFGSMLTANSTAESTWGSSGLLPRDLDRKHMALLFSCLDTATCVALLFFCFWLHRRQQSEASAYSRREITVRKYAVEVRNLPPYFHDRFRLAQWFQARFGPVVDVALAFDQHDLLDVYRQRGRLRKDIDLAVSHGETGRLDNMYDELARIDARIDEIQKDLVHRRTLGAFVVFEHQESRIACERAFQNVWLRSIMSGTATAPTTKGSTRAAVKGGKGTAPAAAPVPSPAPVDDPSKALLFGQAQRVLRVRQAPEPSNIIFRNLKYTPRNKMARKVVTGCATVLLLLVSVVAVYVAQRYQGEFGWDESQHNCPADISAASVRADPSLRDCFCAELGATGALDSERSYSIDCGPWLTALAISRSLGVLAVCVITIVNYALKSLIKVLTQFEKHHSLTRMQESVTVKLFIGLFLNTGVVLLVVNMQLPRYAADLSGFTIAFDGLYNDFVFEWFVRVGMPIVLTMLLNSFNPHLWPLLKVGWARMRREGCCAPRRTDSQSVWNDRFAGDSFELAERYAVLLNTLFVTLLYSGGMPLLLPIGAATFALTYWFDKISFLRLYRIPPRFDHELAMYLTALLPYAVFLHLAFTLWFLSAPVMRSTALAATSGTTAEQLAFNYAASRIADRVFGWETAPTLGLLIGLFAYILCFRVLRGLYRSCRSVNTDPVSFLASASSDSSKFVPYSVARRTVTLETYHPHGSPFYHDAFLRTPSRKMMKIPTPLNVLAERAKIAAKAAEEEAYTQAKMAAQLAVEQAQAQRAFAQLIPAANASRTPLAAPPGVLQQLRGVGPSPTHPHPLPATKPLLVEADDETGGVGLASALGHAASMGVDQRRSMVLSPQQLAAQKEQAKAVARLNTAKLTSAARTLNAVTAFQKKSSPPAPKRAHPQHHHHHHHQQQSSSTTNPAPVPGSASLGASVARGCAQLTGGGDAIVVLDIPEDEMAATQAQVELALRSPAEVEHCDDEDEDAEGCAGGGGEVGDGGDGRPFSTHLQHHAHLSLPSSDPLLPRVQEQVHRMVNRLAQVDEDEAVIDHFPSRRSHKLRSKGKGEHDPTPAAASAAKQKQGAHPSKSKRAVADSSSSSSAWLGEAPAWTEGGGLSPNQPQRGLLDSGAAPDSAATAAATAASGGNGVPSVLPAGSSATRTLSSDSTSSSSSSRQSQSDEGDADGAHQLVPASCPNDQCGRMLELVDTGAPQMVGRSWGRGWAARCMATSAGGRT